MDGNWIEGAVKRPGALKRKAAAAGESTEEFAEAHQGDTGRTGKQARLALTLRKLSHHTTGHVRAIHVGSDYDDEPTNLARVLIQHGERKQAKGGHPAPSPRRSEIYVPHHVARKLKVGQKVRLHIEPA